MKKTQLPVQENRYSAEKCTGNSSLVLNNFIRNCEVWTENSKGPSSKHLKIHILFMF